MTSKAGDTNERYTTVAHDVLIKCAFAVDLYKLYDDYMEQALRIREIAKIPPNEWEKCGQKDPLPEELINTIKSTISNLPDLDDEGKSNLIHFLTDDKKQRREVYGEYKGLDRGDPFQPVAAHALGLRIDQYGIINDLIHKFKSHPQLQAEFIQLVNGITSLEFSAAINASSLSSEFAKALSNSGFTASNTGSKVIHSLISKSFLIITGNSGAGKTKIVSLLTDWLCLKDESAITSLLVPVGSDWTDNRNVLGFVNHLRSAQDEPPVYESTPILELIISAAGDPSRPYFLILDEMNLSHVERYFADFLSAMESGRPIPLHTSATPLKSPQGTDVTAALTLPDNLFITGTVNVDETTYMFSPKVLDRANVIEFRVTPDDAKAFLAAGAGGLGEIEPAPEGASEAFLALSRKARKKPEPDLVFFTDSSLAGTRTAIAESITGLFGIMHSHRMEFGYRTMHEVMRYAGVDYELAADRAAWSWQTCLDVQILQKILPKLHGSKKRIEQLLIDLAVFCETGTAPATTATFTAKSAGKIAYPESYGKLVDMIEAVRRDQFVSFI